jgi:predicted metalloendopeptidase
MTRIHSFVFTALVALCACRADSGATSKPAASPEPAVSGTHDIDRASMDTSISPGDDFYHYANGTWLKNTEIPADRASWGVFDILAEQSQQRTKALLEEARKAAEGSNERKAGDYYASYLDEAAIEMRGLAPLEPVLKDIAAIADRKSLSRWIGQSLRADVDPLNATNFYTDRVFGVWFAQDLNDPTRQVPYLLQGGLGLPDRDYYLEAGTEMDRVRSAYRTHLVNVLTLAQVSDPAATATRINDFERKIAAAHWTRTQSSDVAKANNHWSRADFDTKAPGIDWAALFEGAGLSSAQTFIVWQPDAIVGIAKLVASQPLPTWREYLSYHAVDHSLGVLPKAFADAKVASLIVGIGYPDTWRDYATLKIVRGEAFENAQRASRADYEYQRAKLGRPPDRNEWWMDPQTVNALNLPVQNALNFPAAILVPPYYDPAAPAASNYGAVGAIIGHEISHSFDDTGSQFDATGRFVNWWTPEDLAHFKAAADMLIAQYDAYMPFPDLHVNGKLTIGENIADVAGLSAAYDAYKAQGNTTAESDRAFFISYAQAWKAKRREALARQLVVVDGHAPDEYRADTVRNLDAWYLAFDVKKGQRLYLDPADRVRVW